MRHGLLMTAVATVTVPGLLAILAVTGHEHVAAGRGVTAAALDGTPLSGPSPAASTAMRAAVRGNVAAVQVAGTRVTVFSRVTVSQQAMGMHLLDSAANASQSASYQGTELTSQTGMDGTVKMISQVWHQGGGMTLVRTSNGTTAPASRLAPSSDATAGSPEGVFGVTKPLVALIGENYVTVYRGDGSVAGRVAEVVDLYRFDGSLAARYWLDRQTMVPLRRELFDAADHLISDDLFVRVKFGAVAGRQLAGAAASQPRSAPDPAWIAAAPPSRFLASLADRGWQVPATRPGGLPLYTAASARTADGRVVQLEYSDGLYVVSLFVQRGTLPPDMPGWRQVSVHGQQAFVSGRSVTWAGPGFVYTVIADAPAQTVTQVIGSLPRSAPPGVLDRLGRGFMQLARMINPFD